MLNQGGHGKATRSFDELSPQEMLDELRSEMVSSVIRFPYQCCSQASLVMGQESMRDGKPVISQTIVEVVLEKQATLNKSSALGSIDALSVSLW